MLPDFSVCYWGWSPPGLGLRQFLQPMLHPRLDSGRGADAIFEMFESEGRLSAKIVWLLSEPMTAEGKKKTDIYKVRGFIGIILIGRNYNLDPSEPGI
jgi:hypothetical protein